MVKTGKYSELQYAYLNNLKERIAYLTEVVTSDIFDNFADKRAVASELSALQIEYDNYTQRGLYERDNCAELEERTGVFWYAEKYGF